MLHQIHPSAGWPAPDGDHAPEGITLAFSFFTPGQLHYLSVQVVGRCGEVGWWWWSSAVEDESPALQPPYPAHPRGGVQAI